MICGTFLRYKQIYGEKLPLVTIRENKLFRHRPEAIDRPVIHTHHIYMNEHTFFWMLRAQIRIRYLIWRIFKMVVPKKMPKKLKIEISVSTSNYHRYTQFISRYMYLKMTNTVILVKNSLHIKKDFKIHDGRQFWQKNRYYYEIN